LTEEYPRTTVFAATSETDDYLADSRGRRRYWPLRCGDINLEALMAQREQVFAEALMRYRDGFGWWEMPHETDEEQLARASQDLWTERVLLFADSLWDGRRDGTDPRITSSGILLNIGVEIHKQGDADKGRVARIMRANGWVQRNYKGRYWNKVVRRKESVNDQ
jgi:predicted P-loop ATPase